jgi:hypothetical protein
VKNSWKIRPKIEFEYDKRDYLFVFLPTIMWQPSRYRYNGSCVVSFYWLLFRVGFGIWESIGGD